MTSVEAELVRHTVNSSRDSRSYWQQQKLQIKLFVQLDEVQAIINKVSGSDPCFDFLSLPRVF